MVQVRVTLSDGRPEAVQAECVDVDGVTASRLAGVHWRECYLGPPQFEPCRHFGPSLTPAGGREIRTTEGTAGHAEQRTGPGSPSREVPWFGGVPASLHAPHSVPDPGPTPATPGGGWCRSEVVPGCRITKSTPKSNIPDVVQAYSGISCTHLTSQALREARPRGLGDPHRADPRRGALPSRGPASHRPARRAGGPERRDPTESELSRSRGDTPLLIYDIGPGFFPGASCRLPVGSAVGAVVGTGWSRSPGGSGATPQPL
jgi:hypothetical protein